VRDQQQGQFQRLKDEAHALFGKVEGRPGVRSLTQLQQGDPALAAKALAAKGITVHTVGFIVDTAARGQLQ